ncbi:MAG TPA: phosphotransferase [Paenibacillus sp.]|jgi:Ser/Thr protein kinase RdoA (MazF antagonist)
MDYGNLINEINRSYPINIKHIELHREMIGKVYFLQSQDKRYTLKIYRSFKTDDALQTIRILDYLKENSYPAVSIIRTEQNESHIILSSQDGCCVGILYDYVEGAMPDGKIEAESIGIQIGQLHNLMDKYPDKLKNRPKTEYIDDYISIMRELDFHSGKTLELEQYGNLLWERIMKLPKNFCHGDLHTGNMIRNQSGEYVLLDFDDASGDYPSMDVAYMSDDTNFNHFHESMYDQTMHLCERFYSGYSKVSVLSNNEIHAILDFIAIRHFQIISRIVRCQGMQSVSKEFCDEQYVWLMKWQELCAKKQH